MKYLVMENRLSHSIVMDEAGEFHRVANLGYEIGDTVTDPVFMKSPERKAELSDEHTAEPKDELQEKRRSKFNWKKISTIAAIFVCMLMAGIPVLNSNTASDVMVYMSINPEIHLELNEDGKINKVVADNEDGKDLLEGYEYRGKNASSVLVELIERAKKLEYLSEGGNIRITVKANDDNMAKTVQVDLSEVLKKTYVKKYLIEIKANEDSFRNVEDVLKEESKAAHPEAIETTLGTGETENGYLPTESHTEATQHRTESSSESTTESSKETVKPTQNSKPAEKPTVITRPTEKPTVVTKPSEPTSGTEPPEEPTSGASDPTGGDDDWEWPWWPYNLQSE